MKPKVDLSELVKSPAIRGEDDAETLQLREMLEEAKKYIAAFSWCGGIAESYLGIGVGGIVGVFLFHIVPSREDVDDWIWVVVGDLPPAYLTTDDCPNAPCALDGYIGAMSEWVKAVKERKPVDHLIPVNVVPSPEYAEQLESRLEFLDKHILSRFSSHLTPPTPQGQESEQPRPLKSE